MLGLKLNHVSKRGHRLQFYLHSFVISHQHISTVIKNILYKNDIVQKRTGHAFRVQLHYFRIIWQQKLCGALWGESTCHRWIPIMECQLTVLSILVLRSVIVIRITVSIGQIDTRYKYSGHIVTAFYGWSNIINLLGLRSIFSWIQNCIDWKNKRHF